MNTILSRVLIGAFAASSLLLPAYASAQTQGSLQNVQVAAEAAGIAGQSDITVIVGRIINISLGFLGVIFLCLMIYAGYLWMTAGGDEKAVTKAKDLIKNAIIGLVVIASAWMITSFIFNWLNGNDPFGSIKNGGGNNSGGFVLSSGSLGAGIIESHIPERNASDVPRNTPIIITFKEAIKPESFIEGWTEATPNVDGLNAANIKIYPTTLGTSNALISSKARVKFTKDFKTFVIRPIDYLGSPTNKVKYTVEIAGGAKGIQKKAGGSAFSGAFSAGYIWQFEVSTVVDLVPPKVVDVVPMSGGKFDRNVVIQMNFDKPMDPTAVSGDTASGFGNIEIVAVKVGSPDASPVGGEFTISNQYRTVEFVSNEKCGTNSCGQDVYCLPGDSSVQVTAHAASLESADSPQAQFLSNGYNGVVSVTGNSLDGDADGKAEGPGTDDYSPKGWIFVTTNDVKLDPPRIETTSPGISSPANSNIPLDKPVTIKYLSRLRSSSLNSENVQLDAHGKDEKNADSFWWSVGMALLNDKGEDYDGNQPGAEATRSAIVVSHRPFLPSSIAEPGESLEKKLNFYDPYVFQGVQDVYQNCFNPAAKCGGKDVGQMLKEGPNCCNGKPSSKDCKELLKNP